MEKKATRFPRLSYQMGIDGPIMEFPKKRRQNWSWSKLQKTRGEAVIQIANDLEEYWPLTLRQVYYRSLGVVDGNHLKSWYMLLSDLVQQLRIDGYLPWEAIEDRTRNVSVKRGSPDKATYWKEKLEGLGKYYNRCYVQNQENYVEVWVEKDALSHIVENAAWPYCVQVLTGRGYQSITVQKQFVEDRAKKAIARGQTPYVLYFGDCDPSGINILESAIQNIHDKFHVPEVQFIRPALTFEQIKEYNLPLVPIKVKNKLLPEYEKRFSLDGDAAELDALHPKVLSGIVVDALESLFDMEDMMLQVGIEEREKSEVEQEGQAIRDCFTSLIM